MPAPTITMSSTGPETLGVRNGKVFVDLADITDTNGMAHSFPVTALASSHLPDTQESFTSTQQSNVFSPPLEFLPCTPPTQEESQDGALSQSAPGDAFSLPVTKKEAEENRQQESHDRSASSPESSSLSPPSWNKRLRENLEEANDTPAQKRSKMPL
jgi:hypothetical protein